MLAVYAPAQLQEERLHDLCKLASLDDVHDLLDLVEEHDLFGRVDLGPISQQTQEDLFRQASVLFEELNDAVGQLRVVE